VSVSGAFEPIAGPRSSAATTMCAIASVTGLDHDSGAIDTKYWRSAPPPHVACVSSVEDLRSLHATGRGATFSTCADVDRSAGASIPRGEADRRNGLL
jgi:hypothetical protein